MTVGTEHKCDASEGYRGNGKYEHLQEHRIDMEAPYPQPAPRDAPRAAAIRENPFLTRFLGVGCSNPLGFKIDQSHRAYGASMPPP